ncbi:hypothetical protein PAHAL_4G034000 [Panicum hallii]|uniref:Uncharacterized protein n=1 Tax=Panicum hallii TaxID=206008 RepID=A0A2T8JBL5_9POAL|nr:hypothetical protein PAHAL_4G034000 [Panicum hallii]
MPLQPLMASSPGRGSAACSDSSSRSVSPRASTPPNAMASKSWTYELLEAMDAGAGSSDRPSSALSLQRCAAPRSIGAPAARWARSSSQLHCI